MSSGKQKLKIKRQEEESFRLQKDAAEKSANKLPPIFSFHHLNKDYCITRCDEEDRLAFVDTMYKLSQLSWDVIRTSQRHGLGSEKINASQIRSTIPRHLTPDVPLLAFRFNGMKPMVGYKEKNIFHVIWFDRSMDLYDHGS